MGKGRKVGGGKWGGEREGKKGGRWERGGR